MIKETCLCDFCGQERDDASPYAVPNDVCAVCIALIIKWATAELDTRSILLCAECHACKGTGRIVVNDPDDLSDYYECRQAKKQIRCPHCKPPWEKRK